MRAELLLAMLLITSFATMTNTTDITTVSVENTGTATGTDTIVVHTTSDGSVTETEVVTGQDDSDDDVIAVPVSDSGSSYGECELSSELGDGFTILSARCELILPTPCHTISHSWLPEREENSFVFSVWIRQNPTVCTEVIKETSIYDNIRVSQENPNLDYRIHYEPAKVINQLPENELIKEQTIEQGLPATALCTKEQFQYEEQLRLMSMHLQKLYEQGMAEEAAELEQEMAGIKARLAELPDVSACATISQETMPADETTQLVQRLRAIDERLRLIEPCTKLQYLEEQIDELKQYLESTEISDTEKEAVGEKLSTLVDTRNNMQLACEQLKENEECRNAFVLRQRVQELVSSVRDGSISTIRARVEIAALAEDFARFETSCFRQMVQEVEDHPCMAAQSLRIEIEKLSETGESPDSLSQLIAKTQELEQECRNMQELTPASRPDQASDIARMVGELEIKKQLLLMDDSLSQEQKTGLVRDLETQKTELIKQAVMTQTEARISATVQAKFSPGTVNIDGEEIAARNAVIDVSTTEGDVSVNVGSDELEVQSARVKLRTKLELDFENGLLRLNGKAIKLPDELVDELEASMAELELTEQDGTAVYTGNAQKQFRLFALIPIMANVGIQANAETGQVMSIERPWWAVFAID